MSTSRLPELALEHNPGIERAYAELNQLNHAAASTVEALMYSLRRGADELTKPDTQRRLSELSEDQQPEHELAIRAPQFRQLVQSRCNSVSSCN
jgi:hypothetical protein